MKVYVTDEDISRDVDITASDVHGNDCTEDLILSVVSEKFKDCGGDYGLPPGDRSRAFFRLSPEARLYYGTTVEYAMSKDFYNNLVGLIKEWHIIVKELRENPRAEKILGDTVCSSFPYRLRQHLIGA